MSIPAGSIPLLEQPPDKYDRAYMLRLVGLLNRYMSSYAVRVSHDIGGTAQVPTVVGIQGISVSSTAPTNGQALKYNSTSNQWEPTT